MRFFCLLLFPVLAACGGAETGPVTTTTVQRLISVPGADIGLVRVRTTSPDGSANGIALVGGFSQVVNGVSEDPTLTFEIVEVISARQNSDGSVSGEVVVRDSNGNQTNLLGRFHDEAGLYLAFASGLNTAFATGTAVSNMPSGSYDFSGYARSEYNSVPGYPGMTFFEDGTFTMDVQFSNRTAQITAAWPESAYVNTNLSFNQAGEITGPGGVFEIYDGDGTTLLATRSIDFHGTFHGSGATHVTGAGLTGSSADDYALIGVIGSR